MSRKTIIYLRCNGRSYTFSFPFTSGFTPRPVKAAVASFSSIIGLLSVISFIYQWHPCAIDSEFHLVYGHAFLLIASKKVCQINE